MPAVETSDVSHAQDTEWPQSAFDLISTGVAILNDKGLLILANRALCNMMGFSKTELATKKLHQLVSAADLQALHEQWEDALGNNARHLQIELNYLGKDSRCIRGLTNIAFERDENGSAKRVILEISDITERRKVEAQRLRERLELNQWLEKISETAPGVIGIYRQSVDGRRNIPAWSTPGYEKLYGLNPTELAKDASLIFKQIHPDDYQRVVDSIAESARLLEPWRCEYRIEHPVRGIVWIEGRSQPTTEADGSIVWYGFLHDVTERKQLEMERQQHERHYREVFEHASDCLYLLEVTQEEQFRYLEINSAFERVSGWSRSQLVGKYFDQLAVESSARYVLDELRRCLHSGKTIEWESELALPAGPRTLCGTLIPVRDENNRIYRIVGVSRDITERKRMEELLRAREQQFRTLAENSPHIIVRYDRNLRRIYVNQAHEREFGVPREQSLSAQVEVGWHAITPIEEYKAILNNVLQTGQPAETIVEWPSVRTGEIISYASQFVAERGLDGEVVSVLAKGYNITALKKHERQEEARLRVFEHLAHGGSLPEVLVLVAEYMEKSRPEFIASIMLMDTDKKHLVFGAAPSLPDSYNQQLCSIEVGEGNGSCGTAAWRKKTVIVEDLHTHPHWTGYRDSAIEAGLRACWSEPILDSSGSVLGTFCIYLRQPGRPSAEDLKQVHQVSHLAAIAIQRKRDEAMLRESEQHYREIFDNSLDALFLLEVTQTGHFRSIEVNPAGAKLIGIPRSELIGKTLEEVLPEHLAQQAITKYRTCINEGTTIDEEVKLHFPIGTRVFHLTLIPLHHETGYIYRIIGIARDITERTRAEQILHRREEEFRALVENTPDFIARYDLNARYLYANPALEQLLGAPLAELRGRHPNEIAPAFFTNSPISQRILEVAGSGTPAEMELLSEGLQTEHAPPIVQHVRLVPEFDRSGRVSSILTIGRDISAIRAAERSLEESHARLRDLSRRRETAREEERKRIAREIHDELGQHLTALRMGISLLRFQFGKNNPLLVKRIQSVMTLVDKTIQVVRNVASSLRPAALNMGLPLALEWLVTEFTEHTRLQCRLNVPKEVLHIDDEHATAAFRVVQESLTNIARHAAASRVDIRLTCDSCNYLLEIRDNGKGFDTSAPREKTFGLAGMQERGLMLGGKVSIISSPGNGTLIRLLIPINIPPEQS